MRDDLQRERYEVSQIEREAERLAQFCWHGGIMHRLLMWVARSARAERHDIEREMGLSRPDHEDRRP